MVKIIAGKINTGKTTNLINEYRKNLIGDGFAAVKKMKGKEVYGYTMLRLSDSNTIPWMIHQNHYHQDFTHSSKFGPFYLNLNLLSLLESVVDEFIEKKVMPIYLDEVGVLEIMGGGYHNILKKVLVSGLDLVIAVREDLVKPVTTHFAISDYELIKVPGEE